MNWEAGIWFAVMLGCLLVEGACACHLVCIWFAGGSFAAMVASLLGASGKVQIGLFVVLSLALLIALRPFLKKFITPRLVKTNVDAVIGTQGYVIEAIDNRAATGRVKLGGMEWSARSSSTEPIHAGELVKVDKIEGVKVFVTPVKEKVSN